MKKYKLTSAQKEVLRTTAITDTSPGLILHDFQVALDFVAETRPALTKKHILSLKALGPLNERLSRRIEHGLSRPQQKSFPHINGLFLLLRASGLTRVNATGRSPVLEIDPFAVESWRGLNVEDRYFALLESWLLRGDSEIVGERSGRLIFSHPLRLWSEFFENFDQLSCYEDWIDFARYIPQLHNLGLMELFGLVTVVDGPVETKQGWRIADVRRTEWGEALLALLGDRILTDWDFWRMLEYPQEQKPGELQPIIQPYRPDWQQTLSWPDETYQEGLFIFKVSLTKKVWRQIAIPAESTLADLSNAILRAYQFDHDHLYLFRYPTRFGMSAEVNHPYRDEGPFSDEVRIGDLPAQPGFSMLYNYDFGDNWHFNVVLERIDPSDPSVDRYRIDQSVGKSPEQYGGWD